MSEALPARPDNDVADPWSVPFFEAHALKLDGYLGRAATEADYAAVNQEMRGLALYGACINCHHQLGGLLGSFRWGIAHGHGNCSECNWPVVAYHRVVFTDQERVLTLLLPIHPLLVERRSQDIAA